VPNNPCEFDQNLNPSCEDQLEEQAPSRAAEAYQALRNHLNPLIQGSVTDAALCAIAEFGTGYLIEQSEARDAQLFIASAQGRFLDGKLTTYGIGRPGELGLTDDVYRQLGIEIKSAKQVRSLINSILEIVYGPEFTRASLDSVVEPYDLSGGATLRLSFDGGGPLELELSGFADPSAATAEEVAAAITRALFRIGSDGFAYSKDNGSGAFVKILSPTTGPSSSATLLGGSAQNHLLFPAIRGTTGDATTQWTVERVPGGKMRMTWTGGTNPFLGRAKVGDYVNVYGASFEAENRGTFVVTTAVGGLAGDAYVEFLNPAGVEEVQAQGTADAVLFFQPKRASLTGQLSFAAAFQASPKALSVYLPALTRVVRREKIGGAHLADTGQVTLPCQHGPNIFDPGQPFTVAPEKYSTTSDDLGPLSPYIISLADATPFPEGPHSVVFGYGTSLQEGPVPVVQRPGPNLLFLDPAHRLTKDHPAGTEVTLVEQESPPVPDPVGRDYQFYLTDVVAGRAYAKSLVEFVAATGINLTIIVVYPNDIGLGKWGSANSEKTYVWGE
jgi:hypothetical protein